MSLLKFITIQVKVKGVMYLAEVGITVELCIGEVPAADGFRRAEDSKLTNGT